MAIIAYVLGAYPVLSETFVGQEMRAMEKLGHQIVPIALHRPEDVYQPEDEALATKTFYFSAIGPKESQQLLQRYRFRYRRICSYVREQTTEPPISLLVHSAQMADYIHAQGCTRIHAHFSWGAATYAIAAAKLLKIPVTFTCHGSDVYANPLDLELKCRNADAIFAVAPTITADMQKVAGKTPCHMVYCGVDTEYFKPLQDPTRKHGRWLFVGRLVDCKGVDDIINAWALLPPEHRPMLDIVGDGIMKPALQDLVVSLGLERNITFLGSRPTSWIAEHGPAYRAFISGFRKGNNGSQDTSPLALKEAMAMALPIVTTRFIDIPDLVGEYSSLLCPPASPQDLANAVSRIQHSSPETLQRKGSMGRIEVEARYSLRRQVAQLNQLFGVAWDKKPVSNPHVSIVIPIYNVARFLGEAILSVIADDYPAKEIVVVNDGSNAEATAEITAICAAYPDVRLIHQANMGQAMARGTGVKEARGEYIIFLDADDILLPGAVSHLVKNLDAHPSAIAVYEAKTRIGENGQIIDQTIMPPIEQAASGDVLPALLKGISLFSHGNICMRREFIGAIEFPRHMRQGEDWVTWCRLALLGDIIHTGHRPLLALRTHTQNVSGEVFVNPKTLLAMLDNVFKDEAFIARIGKEKLTEYYHQHVRQIHTYLKYVYADRNQRLRSFKHDFILRHVLPPPPKETIKVLHIVKWFYAGGAERMLSSILKHSDRNKFEHIVLSLSDHGERIGDIRHTLNIPYKSFEIIHGKYNISQHLQCYKFVQQTRPDVIKTWLAPANITGGFMGKLLRKPVIWGIHNVCNQKPYPRDIQQQTRLARFLPKLVVCCSQPAYDTCRQFGYNEEALTLIGNGTDTEEFTFSPEGRNRVRQELGIRDDVVLIGMAAELTPVKRHQHFLIAAKLLLLSHPNVQFVFCGQNATPENPVVKKMIEFLELQRYVHLLGIRNDMANIYSALDIHTLNSYVESFGLAVTEALSCQTLCVATDVGIIPELLADVGEVYPVCDDPAPLVNAWKKMLALPEHEKHERQERGRKRIAENYSIKKTAQAYDDLFQRFGST